MATSPACLNSTRPLLLTVATEVSLLLKTVRRVTSRTLPSANVAITESCCQRPGSVSTRGPGRISMDFSAGRSAGSSCKPSASQPRMDRAGTLLAAKRTAALVRHAAQGLLQHQAGVGVAAVGAAAEHVAGQLQVVGRGVEAAQAQLEAVLARRRAVAGAGVAAADVHGGDHVVAEADRLRLVEVLHRERRADRLAAGLDHQGAGPVLLRRQVAVGNVGEVGRLAGVFAERRQVAHRAVGVAARDDDLLVGAGAGQRDRLRLDQQGRGLADQGGALLADRSGPPHRRPRPSGRRRGRRAIGCGRDEENRVGGGT